MGRTLAIAIGLAAATVTAVVVLFDPAEEGRDAPPDQVLSKDVADDAVGPSPVSAKNDAEQSSGAPAPAGRAGPVDAPTASAPQSSDVRAESGGEDRTTVDAAATPTEPARPTAPEAGTARIDTLRVEPDGLTLISGVTDPDTEVEVALGENVIASGRSGSDGSFILYGDVPRTAAPGALELRSTDAEGRVTLAEQTFIVEPPRPVQALGNDEDGGRPLDTELAALARPPQEEASGEPQAKASGGDERRDALLAQDATIVPRSADASSVGAAVRDANAFGPDTSSVPSRADGATRDRSLQEPAEGTSRATDAVTGGSTGPARGRTVAADANSEAPGPGAAMADAGKSDGVAADATVPWGAGPDTSAGADRAATGSDVTVAEDATAVERPMSEASDIAGPEGDASSTEIETALAAEADADVDVPQASAVSRRIGAARTRLAGSDTGSPQDPTETDPTGERSTTAPVTETGRASPSDVQELAVRASDSGAPDGPDPTRPAPVPAPDAFARPQVGTGEAGLAIRTAPADTAPAAQDLQAPRVLRVDRGGLSVVQGGPVAALSIDTIRYDPDGGTVLGGRAPGDADVRVYVDNAPIDAARSGPDGQWRLNLPQLEEKVYTLRVDQIGGDGTVIARAETPFKPEDAETLDALAATEQDGVRRVTVQPGFTLWAIAERNYGDGLAYVKVFEANATDIRNPDLIYPGQIFDVPQ